MYVLKECNNNQRSTLEAIKYFYGIKTRIINSETREVNYILYSCDESYLRCILKRDIRKNIGNIYNDLLTNQELNIIYLGSGKFILKTDKNNLSIIFNVINKRLE